METRPLIVLAALVLLAFAATLLLRNTGRLEGLELKAYDSYLRISGGQDGPSEPIVMVEYTESDEAAFGYPLPDDILGELLEQLAADQPVAIGLDLIRDRPEPPSDDLTAFNKLSRIFKDTPAIVGIIKQGSGAFGPPPALQDSPFQIGSAAIHHDPDGLIRRGLLHIAEDGSATQPSLAHLLASRYLAANNVDIDWSPEGHLALGKSNIRRFHPESSGFYRHSPKWAGGYQFLLTFPACAVGFERHRLKDVLDRPDSIDVHGRIVLIGNTVRAAKDVVDVPLNCADMTDGKMFGLHLHGQIISQLIGQAEGNLHPMETSAQKFGKPTLGTIFDSGWIWLWTVFGGLTVMLVTSRLWLLVGALAAAMVLIIVNGAAFNALRWWLPFVPAAIGFALTMTMTVVYMMTRAESEREHIMTLFSGVVSKRVADVIWEGRNEPENKPLQLMTATVMFSDIKGFTTISERLSEPVLADWLNDYISVMVDIVAAHGGVIEKFAGDGLTVEFGVPEPRTTEEEIDIDARAAVDCAIAMAESLPHLNAAWEERNLPPIGIRIGIHTGPLMVGMIGSADRWQYSIVGDTANTAARLENYAKDDAEIGCDVGHCRTLISQASWDRLNDDYDADFIGKANLKGKSEMIGIYRVTGRRADKATWPAEVKG